MRIKALYSGKTYTIRHKEAVEYAIIDERDLEADVAMLSKEPLDGIVRFADPAKGWVGSFAWEVREKLLIVTGIPRRSMTGENLIRLEDVRVVKAIPVDKIVEALLAKNEMLVEKLENGGAIGGDEDKVKVEDLEFKIMRVKPCSTTEDLVSTMVDLYSAATVARKRVFFAAPAFIEITNQAATKWYVVTLPRAFQFVRNNPETLVQAGIIDEAGFKAPYIIVKGMTVSDLGDSESQRSSVAYLDNILKIGGGTAQIVGGMISGAGATRPPF